MIRSDKASVSYLYSLLKQLGVRDIVVCPGSRNLPLLHAFSSSEDFNIYPVIDERAAGFIALGMARASSLPVPVITTSGSAVLNLAPALLEAFYERIPMMAITADRPKEMIDKGENQTFNQVNVFANYIVHQLEIDENTSFESFELAANRLYPFLFDPGWRAPVHINMPFSEPLLSAKKILGEFKFDLRQNLAKPKTNLDKLSNFSNKKVIIYNSLSNCSTELENKLQEGAKNLNWIVVNDLQSNCCDKLFLNHFDRVLASNDVPCEVLITIGDQMLSKSARNHFKSIKKLTHIDVSPYIRKWDVLSDRYYHFQMDALEFLDALLSEEFRCLSSYRDTIFSLDTKAGEQHHSFFSEFRYKEFSIIEYITKSFQSDTTIFWGNSSIIRYANWATRNPSVTHQVNRGISGIDGVLSTAIGYQAMVKKEEFYVILGDVSMLYESNALQSLDLIPSIKIIVLNNYGGKIFQNIHAGLDDAHPVMMKHDHSFYHLAKMYDLDYLHCDGLEDFKKTFLDFTNLKNSKAILEISLPSDSNSEWNS